MRIAAMNEQSLSMEVEKPTLQQILEFDGPCVSSAAESTPRASKQIFGSMLTRAQC